MDVEEKAEAKMPTPFKEPVEPLDRAWRDPVRVPTPTMPGAEPEAEAATTAAATETEQPELPTAAEPPAQDAEPLALDAPEEVDEEPEEPVEAVLETPLVAPE